MKLLTRNAMSTKRQSVTPPPAAVASDWRAEAEARGHAAFEEAIMETELNDQPRAAHVAAGKNAGKRRRHGCFRGVVI
jgi:hypothetical protein